MNNEYIHQVLIDSIKLIHDHQCFNDDELRTHMFKLMSLVNNLYVELQQKNETCVCQSQ